MDVGSLFTGIGGLDLGFEREGFNIRWQVENNPYCQQLLKRHFPNAEIYGDIRSIDFRQLPSVDILIGGFPCQPHSTAGKRKGSKDKRDLWPEFYRAICEIHPKIIVAENVPGILSSNHGRFFKGILSDLAKAGYDAEWFTLCASDFGAPHKRERVFIIADSQSNRIQKAEQWNIPYFLTLSFSERLSFFAQESLQGELGFKDWQDIRSIAELEGRPRIPKPLIRRGDDGLRTKLDNYLYKERIQALGNAVVPQVAQFIAREIKRVIEI